MTEITLRCLIDGRDYTADHLALVQHQRHIHVLHQMNRLGATIRHRHRVLSEDDIDLLDPPEARVVSIATRESYGPAGIKRLYQRHLSASDEMWKRANDPPGAHPIVAFANLTVSGVSVEQLSSGEGIANLSDMYISLNPDHYFLHEDDQGHVSAMETFGMYGGPSEVRVTTDLNVPVPFAPEPGYRVLTAGFTSLASDGTNINLLAHHQIKPLDGGFAVKLCSVFPPNTPAALVAGHKVHMAIEFWEMCSRSFSVR